MKRGETSSSRPERAIEHAVVPGSFVSYGVAFSFVRSLEEVETEMPGLSRRTRSNSNRSRR